ncbi:hypothetical protein K8354_00790 [Polaribacter litorisediminis]|uniref:hypothetical protein n=1 Tax=Polaribacter litorisediminis TaxID=1908341 RepID=UPI001CBB3488|nr:hypothetical protein [Polaribacter litorisediminis]UAM98397.1 hypothetical protein K8354_00790 [Polaribacter litorisediminis]
MKKVTTVFLLLCTSIVLAQHKSVAINESIKNTNTEVKVTSMSYKVDSVKELKNIDWDEVKTIFETNKDEELIKMSFGIDLKKTENQKVSIAGKFTVEGKSKNLDDLIAKSKKGINGLIKLYKKYENE